MSDHNSSLEIDEHKTIAQLKAEHGYDGLFGSFPQAQLAVIASMSGVIAVVSLVLEKLTHLRLAHAIGLAYISLPMGVGAVVLTALTLRSSWRLASAPAVLTALYWALLFGWHV